jgi:ribosome-binding protein aMBF1 (putative translation factor)
MRNIYVTYEVTTMVKTAYDRMFEDKMRDPVWAAGYERARLRLEQTERVLRTLDKARIANHLSKADLARRIGAQPSAVRRLFSDDSANPTLGRVAEIAAELGYEIALQPAGAGAKS